MIGRTFTNETAFERVERPSGSCPIRKISLERLVAVDRARGADILDRLPLETAPVAVDHLVDQGRLAGTGDAADGDESVEGDRRDRRSWRLLRGVQSPRRTSCLARRRQGGRRLRRGRAGARHDRKKPGFFRKELRRRSLEEQLAAALAPLGAEDDQMVRPVDDRRDRARRRWTVLPGAADPPQDVEDARRRHARAGRPSARRGCRGCA